MKTIAQRLGALSLAALSSACTGAPSIAVAGAYFPAWLACGLLGVAASIFARMVLAAAGLGQELPLQLLVCVALGVVCGAFAWAAWVGV
jgi:hypothetical protein